MREYPLGAAITLAELDADPHPAQARLRAAEPVSWLPSLAAGWSPATIWCWRRCATLQTFTVDDPRFSTAQVIGPSMLSLDGDEHARHRAPFAGPFRPGAVNERFAEVAQAQARRLVDAIQPHGRAELRRAFAGPMAAAIVTCALGLADEETSDVLGWYDAIVASVTAITAGDGPTAAGTRGIHDAAGAPGGGDRRSRPRFPAGGGRGRRGRAHPRSDRLQRRGAAVRRNRDDRGDDRQRRADADAAARPSRRRPRGPGHAGCRDRRVAAPGARGRRDRPLRDRRRHARRGPDRPRRSRPPVADRRQPGPGRVPRP